MYDMKIALEKKNASIQLERKAFFRNARERYLFFFGNNSKYQWLTEQTNKIIWKIERNIEGVRRTTK